MWKAPAGPSCACTVHRASAFLRDYTRFYTLVRVHRASAFLRSRLQISPNNLQSAVFHSHTPSRSRSRATGRERTAARTQNKKVRWQHLHSAIPTRTSGASASAQHGELLLRLGCTLAPIHRAHGPAHRSTWRPWHAPVQCGMVVRSLRSSTPCCSPRALSPSLKGVTGKRAAASHRRRRSRRRGWSR